MAHPDRLRVVSWKSERQLPPPKKELLLIDGSEIG